MRILFLLLTLSFTSAVTASEPEPMPSGSVKLEVSISPEGSVTDAKVLSTDLPPKFSDTAIAVVKKWHFKPKMKNGKAVASKGVQVVTFGPEK